MIGRVSFLLELTICSPGKYHLKGMNHGREDHNRIIALIHSNGAEAMVHGILQCQLWAQVKDSLCLGKEIPRVVRKEKAKAVLIVVAWITTKPTVLTLLKGKVRVNLGQERLGVKGSMVLRVPLGLGKAVKEHMAWSMSSQQALLRSSLRPNRT